MLKSKGFLQNFNFRCQSYQMCTFHTYSQTAFVVDLLQAFLSTTLTDFTVWISRTVKNNLLQLLNSIGNEENEIWLSVVQYHQFLEECQK